jgi:hypothetical protein
LGIHHGSKRVDDYLEKPEGCVLQMPANVLNGQEADPNAATCWSSVHFLTSRQNMIFSVSMLFYMVGAAHYYDSVLRGQHRKFEVIHGCCSFSVAAISALMQLNCI